MRCRKNVPGSCQVNMLRAKTSSPYTPNLSAQGWRLVLDSRAWGCIPLPFGEGGFEAFEAFEAEGSKGRGEGGG